MIYSIVVKSIKVRDLKVGYHIENMGVIDTVESSVDFSKVYFKSFPGSFKKYLNDDFVNVWEFNKIEIDLKKYEMEDLENLNLRKKDINYILSLKSDFLVITKEEAACFFLQNDYEQNSGRVKNVIHHSERFLIEYESSNGSCLAYSLDPQKMIKLKRLIFICFKKYI